MTIDPRTTRPKELPSPTRDSNSSATANARHPLSAGTFASFFTGVVLSGCFYAIVWLVPWAPLQRYFAGHPIAIAACLLFWFALAVLISKWLRVADQTNRLASLRDADLFPSPPTDGPADRWLEHNDAGHVARRWLRELSQLGQATRSSLLVQRLEELLTRQSQRGTTRHLADDLRELSGRDADAAHDSLGLVRIIVWAIPMLGFLGTVIGITQTLGGLDFTNGSAAVDNLKSGLYVAFDTTAIGLVLSVVAIFLQFPVERSEQRLLADIDARVGHLVSACLPSDETSDNQTVLVAELCRGVQAAVAQSLENQAQLWRQTIDEARSQWQSNHDHSTNRLAEAFQVTLVPALLQHSQSIADASDAAADRLNTACEQWQGTLLNTFEQVSQSNRETELRLTSALKSSLNDVLQPSLQEHARSLADTAHRANERIETVSREYQQTLCDHVNSMTDHQQSVASQVEAFQAAIDRADEISRLQQSLEQHLYELEQTNRSVQRSIDAGAGNGMADAMRILARAVDTLSAQLPKPVTHADRNQTDLRRAA